MTTRQMAKELLDAAQAQIPDNALLTMEPLGDQQITVDDTTRGVRLAIPDNARRCYVEIWTADVYYTLDGATPSSTNGGRASPGDVITMMGTSQYSMLSNMEKLRMIRQTATSALAIVHYFT